MSDASQVAVVLVDLPGFYKGMLDEQFSRLHVEHAFMVTHLASAAVPEHLDCEDKTSVIVAAATPVALRCAHDLLERTRVVATIAVTDDVPRGDVYLVSPAGLNVSDHKLAQLICDVATIGPPSFAARTSTARLLGSDS